MKNSAREGRGEPRTKSGNPPALQVICLASGGGPTEDNVTGFLVRSVATRWGKGSVLALDAGSHLGSITRLLEQHFPPVSGFDPELAAPSRQRRGREDSVATVDQHRTRESSEASDETSTPEPSYTTLTSGPFAGVPFPNESARANALHLVRECISTYLISHPHLDHLAAFVINTAAFHNTSRPKRLAALASTVNAIKMHIFNDVIWPNLTDEDGGVGLVTFQRLAQGGNSAVGEGHGKGYIEVCDGICVKGMKISHGRCSHHSANITHRSSDVGLSETNIATRNNSTAADHGHISPNSVRRTPSIPQQFAHTSPGQAPYPGSSSANTSPHQQHPSHSSDTTFANRDLVVDSTAYFIRDDATGTEMLFFGDVEPDSLSLHPRTAQVWTDAAPKIASGSLRAVFIECSYADSQADNILFGHLAPRHLIHELTVLAEMVKTKRAERKERHLRKRKRHSSSHLHPSASSAAGLQSLLQDTGGYTDASGPPTDVDEFGSQENGSANKKTRMSRPHVTLDLNNLPEPSSDPPPASGELSRVNTMGEIPRTNTMTVAAEAGAPPLTGLTVIVIHAKDTMKDGPLVGETILRQLKEHEAKLVEKDGLGLGCEFVISRVGESYWI